MKSKDQERRRVMPTQAETAAKAAGFFDLDIYPLGAIVIDILKLWITLDRNRHFCYDWKLFWGQAKAHHSAPTLELFRRRLL